MTSSGTSNACSLHLTCLLTHLKCIAQTNKMFRMQKLQPIQTTSSQIKCIFCSIRLVLFETIEMHFSVIVTIFVCQMYFLSPELYFQMHFFQTVQSDSFTFNALLCILNAFLGAFYVCSFPDEMCCLQFNHSTRPTAYTRARAHARVRKRKFAFDTMQMYFFLHGHFDLRTFENF